MKLRLDEINVGHRARSDLGDIDALAQSIATLGQLQPVVVTPDRLLVAGARRIAACASLGLAEVEARVVVNLADATDLLRAERDENTCRKDFTPSEAARLGAALEALERPRAKERMRTGGAVGGQGGGKLPQASAKTRDVVGEAVGLSGRTYEKAAEVREKVDRALPYLERGLSWSEACEAWANDHEPVPA